MSEPRFFGNVFRDAERNTENNENADDDGENGGQSVIRLTSARISGVP